MNTSLFVLIIIAWLPALIVIMFNTLWDIAFWQKREYRPEKMLHQLNWDFHPTHRNRFEVAAKIVIFIFLCGAIVLPGVNFPWILLIFAYAIWVHELLNIGDHFFANRMIGMRKDPRAVGIFALILLSINLPVGILFSNLSTNSISSEQGLLLTLPQLVGQGIALAPDIFVSLLFLTLLGLVFDLTSPLTTSLAVIVTYPISLINVHLQILRARTKLKAIPDLRIVAITGTVGKSTTAHLLHQLLERDFRVVHSNWSASNIAGVARTINSKLENNTQVLILELSTFHRGEILRIGDILKLDVAIITGIDSDHMGLFGSQQALLDGQAEVLQILKPGGTAVLNGDNELVVELAGRNLGKEILYYLDKDPHHHLLNNQLEIDIFDAREHHVEGDSWLINFKNSQREYPLRLPLEARRVGHSVVAAIAASLEISGDIGKVIHLLGKMSYLRFSGIEKLTGDNGSQIWIDYSAHNLRKFESSLENLKDIQSPKKILITGGLTELGRYKGNVYSKIGNNILTAAEIIFTTDKILATTISRQDHKANVVHEFSARKMLPQIRQHLVPGSIILLHGELDPYLISELRSEYE